MQRENMKLSTALATSNAASFVQVESLLANTSQEARIKLTPISSFVDMLLAQNNA